MGSCWLTWTGAARGSLLASCLYLQHHLLIHRWVAPKSCHMLQLHAGQWQLEGKAPCYPPCLHLGGILFPQPAPR